MPYLFFILILVPVIEIFLFIEIGGVIGIFPTILIVVVTAILGSYLLKKEGLSLLQDFAMKSATGGNVSQVLLEGLMVVFAGALLLTPGFMTDLFGFLLIMPYSRKFIGQSLTVWFLSRFKSGFHYSYSSNHSRKPQQSQQDDDIIDVEYEEIEPKKEGD